MRHRIAGYKLGRDTEHRVALFRNLAAALFQHGQITTTLPKAKAVQPFVEKLITLAKRGDLHARRQAIAKLQDRELVFTIKGGAEPEEVADKTLIQTLFEEIGPRYANRPGGYTRIVRLSEYRVGDGGELVVLQLVSDEDSGPQVGGRHSRRREKQNKRSTFAAQRRKGGRAAAAEEAGAPADSTEATATATAEEPSAEAESAGPAEQPASEAAEQSADRADEKKPE